VSAIRSSTSNIELVASFAQVKTCNQFFGCFVMAETTKIRLDPDRWVADRPERGVSGKRVRLTVDLLPDLHKKLKVKATMEEKTMQEIVQQWIAEKVE
jgi:hypothetical protein